MNECLNPESRDPAYLCGRLFAVFDRLQYFALGGVNAGVVERYYASASVTPALVMGRLFRNAQFHLAKAEGRFALGFYHQKADYRRRTAERKEAEAKVQSASSI